MFHFLTQVEKFAELQQKRKALESSSDDNVDGSGGGAPKMQRESPRSQHRAADFILLPERPSSGGAERRGSPRVIAWRLSPKGTHSISIG